MTSRASRLASATTDLLVIIRHRALSAGNSVSDRRHAPCHSVSSRPPCPPQDHGYDAHARDEWTKIPVVGCRQPAPCSPRAVWMLADRSLPSPSVLNRQCPPPTLGCG